MIKPYIENGRMAVLVSKGCGAGWSTWNSKELAWDSRVVEKWFELRDTHPDWDEEMKEYLQSIGYDEAYVGGASQLELEWVGLGKYFIVVEYNGAETLITQDTMTKWDGYLGQGDDI